MSAHVTYPATILCDITMFCDIPMCPHPKLPMYICEEEKRVCISPCADYNVHLGLCAGSVHGQNASMYETGPKGLVHQTLSVFFCF